MDEAVATARYWCHMCSQVVNPVTEDELNCPQCSSGFIEEMEGRVGGGGALVTASPSSADNNATSPSAADLSLWAPILLGMFNDGLRRRQRPVREDSNSEHGNELVSLFRRRQRASAILEVLNDIQTRLGSDSPHRERERQRREPQPHMILVNPFSQLNNNIGASLGDYFIGPGLEQLLQHLADSDPARHGTPPAWKEAVEAMPKVRIEEKTSCYVCLEDFEDGEEVREMPCKHRFHDGCIFPWLEAHSSCPVCRFQMPTEGPKDSNGGDREGSSSGTAGGESEENGGARSWMPVPWPFSGLFSLTSGNESGSNNSNGHPDEN